VPRDERRLRPDHDEVAGHGGLHESGDVVDADVDERRLLGDSRVAGRGQDLGRRRRPLQGAHERVLAPARADDEDARRQSEPARVHQWSVRPVGRTTRSRR
jgi:hypothetical protein